MSDPDAPPAPPFVPPVEAAALQAQLAKLQAEHAAMNQQLGQVRHERDELQGHREKLMGLVRDAYSQDPEFAGRLAELYRTGTLPRGASAATPGPAAPPDLSDPAQLQAWVQSQIQEAVAQVRAQQAPTEGRARQAEFNTAYLLLAQKVGNDRALVALPKIQAWAQQHGVADLSKIPGGLEAAYRVVMFEDEQQHAIQRFSEAEAKKRQDALASQGLAGGMPHGTLPNLAEIRKQEGTTGSVAKIFELMGMPNTDQAAG